LKADDEGLTGFTTKLVKTLLFARPREKAPPAWAVFHFNRADWRVIFSAYWYDGSRVRIPEPAAIIPQACAQHYCQRQPTGKITHNPDFSGGRGGG
jgi:hypothetical protein